MTPYDMQIDMQCFDVPKPGAEAFSSEMSDPTESRLTYEMIVPDSLFICARKQFASWHRRQFAWLISKQTLG